MGRSLNNLKSRSFNPAKELDSTVNHRSNTFATGVGMADILAHLHVDEDTLSAAMLYRSVREGITDIEEVKQKLGSKFTTLSKVLWQWVNSQNLLKK